MIFSNNKQAQLEFKKWKTSRDDANDALLRNSVADLIKKLAIGNWAIAWMAWTANYERDAFTLANLENYNKEIKALLPELVAARVILAAIDHQYHAALSPLVTEFYDRESRTARSAANWLRHSSQEDLKVLQDIFREVSEFDRRLISESTELMKRVDTGKRATGS